MGRTFLVLAVIGAFVLGSIATGAIVYADDNDDSKGNPLKKIVKLLKQILTAIEEQEVNVVVDEVTIANTEPIEVTGSLTSNPVCPAENVQHWTSFQVDFANDPHNVKHPTEPQLSGGLFLNIPITGSEIVTHSNAAQKAADRLNDLGYFVDDNGTPRPVEESEVHAGLNDPSFSTICAEN